MKQSSKSVTAFIGLILIYILLARAGIYSTAGIVLFPILSIPLAICLIKNKLPLGLDFLFNIAIILGIYLLTNSIQSVSVFIISICIPAYAVSVLHKKRVPLPNMIMYVSILMAVIIFIYIGIMKYLGVDYELQFRTSMDAVKQLYFEALETISRLSQETNVLETSMMKELITLIIDTIKQIFPALILTGGLLLTTTQVIVLNMLVKKKGERLRSLKELFNFRLSKVTVILFFIAIMLLTFGQGIDEVVKILSLNIFFFLEFLMKVMGIVSILVLIKRSHVNTGIKVLGYMILVILIITPTSILMMFGCFDTMFNYRKAEIIV
ncbi:MAG: Protein of unknown function rane [Clostridia bacterium]|jgi:hypothetical protein|nr:Protein of unknown function rane [Clostridia bacterium]